MIYEMIPWQQSLSSLAPLGYFFIICLWVPVKCFCHGIQEDLVRSESVRSNLKHSGGVDSLRISKVKNSLFLKKISNNIGNMFSSWKWTDWFCFLTFQANLTASPKSGVQAVSLLKLYYLFITFLNRWKERRLTLNSNETLLYLSLIILLIWVKCIIEYFKMTLACLLGQEITCLFFLEVTMHQC